MHLLSDLLGKADGVVAFREVLESSPALRALLVSGTGVAAPAAEGHGTNPMVVDEEAKYRLVEEKLMGKEINGGV